MWPRAVVVGLGMSGEAVARGLADRGTSVVVVEDVVSAATAERAARLSGVDVVEAPDTATLDALVAGADLVVPSPGVPPRHPVFAAAAGRGIPVLSEVEVASRWTDRPLVAVTGTNGKTTVTTLITQMLQESGAAAVAAGNIGVPLSEAVTGPADVLVVEVSSFQLQLIERFRPRVAVWLNLADDHRNWHPDLEHYAAAKARVWANQDGDDLALGNADDATVAAAIRRAPARRQTFTLGGADRGDWHVAGGALRAPDGRALLDVDDLPRSLPHDVANALASSAAACAMGATDGAVGHVLSSFASLPHRVTLVGHAGGVRWYDDSKATNPHAVLAALAGFDSVVLIAGGDSKGVDLSPLAGAAARVRAVIAIGDAAPEVEAVFTGRVPVVTAASMDDAVAAAAAHAAEGDAVLLSPGCASFDWYRSYAERGDDFARAVRVLVRRSGGDAG